MSDVKANYQYNGSNPGIVGGTGSARKFFPMPPGPSIGVSNSTPSATNATGMLPVPGNNSLNGQTFVIEAVGSVFTDPSLACPTITVELIAVTGSNLTQNPIYTVLSTTGGLTTSSLSFIDEPFKLSVTGSCDSDSGVLQGVETALYNNVLVQSTPKVLPTTLTGINMGAAVPFGLVVAVTFSISGAANKAKLYQFTLSA